MYLADNSQTNKTVELFRYTTRVDGMVRRKASYDGGIITSNEFIMIASNIRVNFATSVIGSMKITIKSEDGIVLESCEHFGNKIDRLIKFNQDLSILKNKKCIMEIKLIDGEIYSINFEE